MKTTENEMAPHFRRAIEELDGDIDKLQGDLERLLNARQTIVELYGGDTVLPEPPLRPRASLPDRSPVVQSPGRKNGGGRRKVIAAVVPGENGAETRRTEAGGDSLKALAVARTCAEPFTVASLVVATGQDKKFCSNRITIWFQKGWLERTGRGAYKRSGSFPASTPNE